MKVVDINCDVGEGVGNEELLLPYISSCNIACGGHAGDVETIDHVITLAIKHGVKIGAHPSFPDRANFGRKVMDISSEDLESSLIEQIELIQQRLAKLEACKLHHVKVHGALYNLSAVNKEIAQVVLNSIIETAPHAKVYVPYKSILWKMAREQGLNTVIEAFADRNYTDDLKLVSRNEPNAVIHDKEKVAAHFNSHDDVSKCHYDIRK